MEKKSVVSEEDVGGIMKKKRALVVMRPLCPIVRGEVVVGEMYAVVKM